MRHILHWLFPYLFDAPLRKRRGLPDPEARCVVKNEPKWQSGRVRR